MKIGRTLALVVYLCLFCMPLVRVYADAQEYSSVVLGDNPLAYYRFEEASISQLASAAGDSRFAGTYAGGVSLAAGRETQGAWFDNVGSHVNLGYHLGAALHGASAVTVEAWIRNADLPPQGVEENAVFSSILGTGSGVILQMNGSGIQMGGRSWARDGFQSKVVEFSSTDSWHHLVGVLDYRYDEIRIYIDGVLKNTSDRSVAFASPKYYYQTATKEDSIGAMLDGGPCRVFNGGIDELAVYTYALDDVNGDGIPEFGDDNHVLMHFNSAPEPLTALLMLVGGAVVISRRRIPRR